MNFWQLHYTQCLMENNLIQPIYDAMKNDDHSKVIMVVLNILEKNNLFPTIEKPMKSEIKSNQLRNEGNEEFKKKNYCKALEFYNKALMYAPQNTESEKFAYSNRSAVLYKNKEYTACVVDIQICFRLGCPLKIIEKLKKRMEQALPLTEQEESVRKHINAYAYEFYQFDVNAGVNTQIPSASTDLEVVKENNDRKIIAAKDIKVGTVLAIEPAFVSCNASPYFSIACHYCHKISLNLIPCHGCCSVMFCNEKCKKFCMEEYHKIECEIIEVISTLNDNQKDVLMVNGAIKFVRMCKSWKEVISASYCTGKDRIDSSSVQEMFDVNNKLSVLSYNSDLQFVHGQIFNTCFVCAIVIYYLEKVPAFMPGLYGEKKLAKEALGRLMMYFKLYATPTLINQITSNRKSSTIYYNELFNSGWYPLIGKLKDSCMPNVIVSNLNKKAALIALQPIKKGTELTVPHLHHHLNLENISIQKKNYIKFYLFEKECKCTICNDFQNSKCLLTKEQLDTYNKILLANDDDKINILNIHRYLPKMCELLTCLNNAPLSNEYKNVYSKFYECLMACEEALTDNCVLDTFQFSPK